MKKLMIMWGLTLSCWSAVGFGIPPQQTPKQDTTKRDKKKPLKLKATKKKYSIKKRDTLQKLPVPIDTTIPDIKPPE